MPKIFIDAGHGGKDSGATNGNYFEKDIALKIALKLNEMLELKGFKTQLSRTTDVFVELNERAKKANQFNADIFVSIHLNSATNSSANGIETLVYKNQGKNYVLGANIQNELIQTMSATNRGIKERPELCVLNSTKMPAVLIEVGFLSNAREKSFLVLDAYQNKIALAIANGILKYFGMEDKTVSESKEIKTVDEALKILKNRGVINSLGYWLKAVDVVKYLDELIINVARKIG